MRNLYLLIITVFMFSACSSKNAASDSDLDAQFEEHAEAEGSDSGGQLTDSEVSEMYEAAGMEAPSDSRAPASMNGYDPNMTPEQTLVYASQHAVSRGPASAPEAKGSFWTMGSACGVHAQPDSNSEVYGNLSDGRSLWVEQTQVDGWVMVQRQAGPAYMQSQCFQ